MCGGAFLMSVSLQVILNQKAKKGTDGKFVLSPSGESLQADVVYTCIAGKPHSEWLRKHPAVLDQGGYVKVRNLFCFPTFFCFPRFRVCIEALQAVMGLFDPGTTMSRWPPNLLIALFFCHLLLCLSCSLCWGLVSRAT